MHDLALPAGRTANPFPSAHLLKEEIVLGFDFGTRRLGVAVGNAITRQARPLALIADVGDVRWRRISELIGSWQPARLVAGIPRHPDGTAHELTARCERFARQLESEVSANAWLTVDAQPTIIFDTPAEARQAAALRLLGIDPAQLSAQAGHA